MTTLGRLRSFFVYSYNTSAMIQESLIYLLTISFFALIPFVNAQENYCHDPYKIAYWDDLAIRATDHSDVINLYKYGKVLCAKIDSGEPLVSEATEKYERERIAERLERGKF